jgi:hypothetical protein
MKLCRTALLFAVALGLAACKGENKGSDQRTAVGEILPGSASDAMVPYDSLRSQPPLAPSTGSAATGKDKDKGKGKGRGEGGAPEAQATDADAATVPAEPSPTPTPESPGE